MFLITGLPLVPIVAAFSAIHDAFLAAAVALPMPVLYAALVAITAGLLSLPHQRHIIEGRFPRDPNHPVYAGRRLYGICWTTLYYNKPAYSICLSISPLRNAVLRLFGYRGSANVTLYPDSWIRDLPLLDLGRGTYVANRATLGTNLALPNGEILVRRIRTGKNCVVGHLAMLAPGTTLGDDVVVDAGSALGVGVVVGRSSVIHGTSTVSHFARVGDESSIGYHSYVGMRSSLPQRSVVPDFSIFPPRSTATQNQATRDNANLGAPI